jgi:cytochrome c556
MLSKKLLKSLTAGALVLGFGITLAYAAADDVIKARQNFMKERTKAMGPMIAIMKGEAPYDAAVVKASLDAVNATREAVKDIELFAPDTAKGETVETFAKPEIWSDPEGFKAADEAMEKAFSDVAATTDEAGFKAAFPAVGAACGGCHEKFRRPKG